MDIISKTKEDYNKIAEFFAKTRSDERELLQFSALLKAGQRVLDWGCGNGRLIHLLKERGIQYVGIDQSEEMIRMAEEEFKAECSQGWASFKVVPGLPPWPLVDNSFDGVFAVASLHHLQTRQQRAAVLKEMARVLKSGGYLVVTTWNLTSDWAAEHKAKGVWQEADESGAYWIPWKSADGAVLAERYYRHLEPDDVEDAVTQAGLQMTACYWSSESKETDRREGKNLVCIARKM